MATEHDSEDISLYALNWSFFDKNLKNTLRNVRSLRRYSDVTILCQDKTIYAHRLILHAGSEYFRELFENPRTNSNLVIYMYHVKGVVMKKLLEYIYCGEVQIEKNHLQDFIMLGQSLKVKGLVNPIEDLSENNSESEPTQKKRKRFEECILSKSKDQNPENIESNPLAFEENHETLETNQSHEILTDPIANESEKSDNHVDDVTEEIENNSSLIFQRTVTKSFSRYQKLVANVKRKSDAPHEISSGTRRRCAHCSIQKVEKRTSYYCKTCNIALCRNCFEPFHKTFDGGSISGNVQ